MREAFNFYSSYYEVYKELKSKEDKLAFIDALLERQFNGIEPKELKGMARFAYISQKFNIDKQVSGWETIKKKKLNTPTEGVLPPPTEGGTDPLPEQGKGKEEGKGKVKGKEGEEDIAVKVFDIFRKKYGGIKRGNETEFANFQKHNDWETVLPLLENAVDNQIKTREAKIQKKEFVPEWKNLQTWINQRCWEQEQQLPKAEETKKHNFVNLGGIV